MHNSQWTEFNSQMMPKCILSLPGIKPAFTKMRNGGLQSVSEISRQGQSKDPSWTYFRKPKLAGLGLLFVLKIRADSRRSRAPSDLSYWWKQSRVPTRVQFPRASYSRCTSIGFNEESSFDQLVTQETDRSERDDQHRGRETALRERRLWGWAKWGLISSKQMGTLRRRGTRAQDLTCPYVPLIRIQLELRGSDDMKWHGSRDMNTRVNNSWTHWYIWLCVRVDPSVQINLEPLHHSHKTPSLSISIKQPN